MSALFYYIVHLLPELLSLLGIGVAALVEYRKAKVEGARQRDRTLQVGGIFLFLIILLLAPIRHLLPAESGSFHGLQFFPLEPTSQGGEGGLLVLDPLAIFFKMGIALLGLVGACAGIRTLSKREEKRDEEPAGRFLTGLFGAAFAGFLLVGANDLLILWGGVELLVLASRITVPGEVRKRPYLYGGIFSALTLFGIVLFYGLFGTTELSTIAQTLSVRNAETVPVNGLLMAILCLFGGLVARLGMGLAEITPQTTFHLPPSSLRSPVLFAMIVLVGYAVLVRLTVGLFPPDLQGIDIETLVLFLGGAIGIGCALLMAGADTPSQGIRYGIGAHLGMALLSLAPRSTAGLLSGTLYLFMHLSLTLAVVVGMRNITGVEPGALIAELRGKGRLNRANDLFLAIFLLTLAGLPFTGGFLARFFLFGSLTEGKNLSLSALCLGAVISILLLYTYGRRLHALYFSASQGGDAEPLILIREEMTLASRSRSVTLLLGVCAAGALISGFPGGFHLLWKSLRLALGYS